MTYHYFILPPNASCRIDNPLSISSSVIINGGIILIDLLPPIRLRGSQSAFSLLYVLLSCVQFVNDSLWRETSRIGSPICSLRYGRI